MGKAKFSGNFKRDYVYQIRCKGTGIYASYGFLTATHEELKLSPIPAAN